MKPTKSTFALWIVLGGMGGLLIGALMGYMLVFAGMSIGVVDWREPTMIGLMLLGGPPVAGLWLGIYLVVQKGHRKAGK